ncbi:MAG: hypothetical protein KC643_20490 [Nitrospira sp.]|nr:hypothetical protein [Nitrospira sp.]
MTDFEHRFLNENFLGPMEPIDESEESRGLGSMVELLKKLHLAVPGKGWFRPANTWRLGNLQPEKYGGKV